jgi:hypothetical protein
VIEKWGLGKMTAPRPTGPFSAIPVLRTLWERSLFHAEQPSGGSSSGRDLEHVAV